MATNGFGRKSRKLIEWVQSPEARWAAMLNLANLAAEHDSKLEEALDRAADAALPGERAGWREKMPGGRE